MSFSLLAEHAQRRCRERSNHWAAGHHLLRSRLLAFARCADSVHNMSIWLGHCCMPPPSCWPPQHVSPQLIHMYSGKDTGSAAWLCLGLSW